MRLDKRALERLLTLNDEQLKQVIEKLAADSGLNLGALNISTADIARLRTALSGADEGDVTRLAQQLKSMKQPGNGQNGGAG